MADHAPHCLNASKLSQSTPGLRTRHTVKGPAWTVTRMGATMDLDQPQPLINQNRDTNDSSTILTEQSHALFMEKCCLSLLF